MDDRYFSLVLHSHIPFVLSHGDWPHGMDWLYEAAAETYLPLLDVFNRLALEGIPPRVNIGFTPVLMEQICHPDFRTGFDRYLKMKLEAARSDRAFFARTGDSALEPLTIFWEKTYEKLLGDFHDTWGGDILGGFRKLQDAGQLEILTSAATHGYFPLLGKDESIRAQVRQGRHTYRRRLGREPKGFWIPECAYRPSYIWKPPLGDGTPYPRLGVDEILGQEGLSYFFVDGHLLRGGEAKGVYLERFPGLKLLWEKFKTQYVPGREFERDPYAAYLAYPSHLPFFVRDEVSGSQVWSRYMGYPGDGWYLEFHKKHFPGGMRYWRITSSEADLALKLPYDPGKTRERMEEHASHFVQGLEQSLAERKEGVIVSLYDTELFGHWWFEGPEWLEKVLRKLQGSSVRPATAGESLDCLPPRTLVSLPEGSWGKGGFHWIWLNEDTSWIWEKIYAIEAEARKVESLPAPDRRVLKQFYREKYLLESSDWPFLISTWTARDYAENRAAEHFLRARTLASWLVSGKPLGGQEIALLEQFEKEDNLFEEIIGSDGNVIP